MLAPSCFGGTMARVVLLVGQFAEITVFFGAAAALMFGMSIIR
jgi:hypothetical protein